MSHIALDPEKNLGARSVRLLIGCGCGDLKKEKSISFRRNFHETNLVETCISLTLSTLIAWSRST